MTNQRKLLATSAAVFVAAFVATMQPAQAAESFTEMFTEGKAGVSFRYRYEFVDQENLAKDAQASTLRGRLNFKTDDWKGFGSFAEFDYLSDVIWNDYNAGAGNTPNRTHYPVVADPTGPDLNQAFLQWQNGAAGSLVRGGRQRIIYDNARFVGNVGWRQNEQTYDAAYFQQKVAAVDFQLAYVWQVNRIFGDDVPAGENENSTVLGNLGYNLEGLGKLTGYYYDIDNDDVASFSTSTYGGRFVGTYKFGENAFGYALEYAHQSDAHNNPLAYSANYYRIDASLGIGKITPYVGYESLGGDDSKAGASFRTPLATLHAFNGWADMFLNTPAAGLNDFFVGVKGVSGTWNWDALYHDFDAQSGSQSFGSETDASIGRKFAEKYSVLFKAALFAASKSSPYPDTTKVWVQLTADF
ncbi:MAG: alginate export family protein [Xanthomonadales bacterium]|nr:alginate export family protein [Xanthomonadales bacterium]